MLFRSTSLVSAVTLAVFAFRTTDVATQTNDCICDRAESGIYVPTVYVQNVCQQALDVNICNMFKGEPSFMEHRNAHRLAVGASWSFAFFDPSGAEFKYRLRRCETNVTTRTDTCKPECPAWTETGSAGDSCKVQVRDDMVDWDGPCRNGKALQQTAAEALAAYEGRQTAAGALHDRVAGALKQWDTQAQYLDMAHAFVPDARAVLAQALEADRRVPNGERLLAAFDAAIAAHYDAGADTREIPHERHATTTIWQSVAHLRRTGIETARAVRQHHGRGGSPLRRRCQGSKGPPQSGGRGRPRQAPEHPQPGRQRHPRTGGPSQRGVRPAVATRLRPADRSARSSERGPCEGCRCPQRRVRGNPADSTADLPGHAHRRGGPPPGLARARR